MVLRFEPRRAERKLEPTVRRVVDRDRLGSEERRMPVRDAGDEQAEAKARRDARQRGQCAHSLEAVARPLAVHRLEVIEAPRAVEAHLFGELRTVDELFPLHPLLGNVDPEAHDPQATGCGADHAG